MRLPVFADAFYWVALIDPRDKSHADAVDLERQIADRPIVTTDEVLTEVLTLFAGASRLRGRATATIRDILQDDTIIIVPQSRESFLSGFALYADRPDKSYSLTDCISMHTMRRAGISDVLTNDRHFEQEGFRALFRPSSGDYAALGLTRERSRIRCRSWRRRLRSLRVKSCG